MSQSPPIVLTNTLGHQRELFEPISPGQVLMYTCGPTVYSYAHIGNFRSFLFADVLRRVLEYNGYRVTHARNITDVGHLTNETLNTGLDRIEMAAREQHESPEAIIGHFTDAFLDDARRLNLLEPSYLPRATQYVAPMIALTQQLIEGGHAYAAEGDVYFDVSTFSGYGELSGNSVEDLVAGARVEVGTGKHSPADFALWRGAGPDKIMRFDSPWGQGVPGWHIECSAMARELLADQIDIHTGGVDNIFPHHEDERAQSEAASGTRFVRYWVHSGWLLVEDEKMAKSAGNIYTVQDLVDRGFHPLAFRYLTFQAHYRTPLNFTWDALRAAQTALCRLWEASAELVQTSEPGEIGPDAEALRRRLHEAINRDLDMPVALSVLHEVVGAKLPAADKLALFQDFDRVFGLSLLESGTALSQTTPEQQVLLERRHEARAARDWAESDRLRAELANSGLDVRDTPHGQRWVRTGAIIGC